MPIHLARLTLTLAMFATACSKPAQPAHRPEPIPSLASIRTAAERDATRAITTNQLYLCETGTRAVQAPGVSEHDLPLVRNLPVRVLPNGCSNPQVFYAIAYAEIFNRTVVNHLKRSSTK